MDPSKRTKEALLGKLTLCDLGDPGTRVHDVECSAARTPPPSSLDTVVPGLEKLVTSF